MNKFSYRDKEYAEYIYNNGFLTKYHSTELGFLALYLRDVVGITKKKDRKNELIGFCSEHIKEFNYASRFKQINKALNFSCGRKNKLVTVEFVPVSRCEYNYINESNISADQKKVLFTLLVLSRLKKYYFEEKYGKKYASGYYSGGSKSYSELKKICKINSKTNINSNIINDLANKGLVTICIKGTIRLDFLDKIDYTEDDEVIAEVKSYLDIGYYWDLLCGNKRIALCGNCGNIFCKTSNNQIYCKDCQGYLKQGTKTLICVNCGKEFEVDSMVNHKTRCDDCQKEYIKA